MLLVGGHACGHDTGARDHFAETLQKEKQSEQTQENCTQCTHCQLCNYANFSTVGSAMVFFPFFCHLFFAIYFKNHPKHQTFSAQLWPSNIDGQVNDYSTNSLMPHFRLFHGGRRSDKYGPAWIWSKSARSAVFSEVIVLKRNTTFHSTTLARVPRFTPCYASLVFDFLFFFFPFYSFLFPFTCSVMQLRNVFLMQC